MRVLPARNVAATLLSGLVGVSVFPPRTWLDRVFVVGIIGMGLNGVVELLGGPTHYEIVQRLMAVDGWRCLRLGALPYCRWLAMASDGWWWTGGSGADRRGLHLAIAHTSTGVIISSSAGTNDRWIETY